MYLVDIMVVWDSQFSKKNDPHQQGHPDAMSWNMSAEAQFLAFVMHAKDACLPQPFEKKGYPSRMGHQCEPNHEHSTEKQYVSLKKTFHHCP